MKYKIEIDPKHLVYIGNLLDKQPHGEVVAMVCDIQAQITAQDEAQRASNAAGFEKARLNWFEGETRRRAEEAVASAQEQPAAPKEGE